ncbi:glycogen synthase GlgA [Candidatus Chrysopegis kryptomonas]|jgi:starch synthase|uniref:Glycogen synthase n=1 Tax=Candidatus Chryseopegocella kryptomonas TaxID=1633643 RepID=A0A0P1NXQ5_9BACT|nr:glycogen synthase GlgA [Candidatus Chrysopegis kryptomonas]CUT03912.1 starch synthase [Candidatus Chrysopegis kryptomonas]
MAQSLNILFLSSEVVPFAKTGGLADVSFALPQAIKELGHEIRVMMPKYGFISERKFGIHEIIRLREMDIPVGDKLQKGSAKASFIVGQKIKVQIYFLENDFYYNRDGLYVDSKTKTDYPDNDERFIFFCKGVIETLKKLGWRPDIIHCNDWQTALVPVYLKTIYKDDPFLSGIKTVLTIHNIGYQGVFPKESFLKSGLPDEIFSQISHNGNFNFLKAGILYADVITTVSPTYAKEIMTSDEYGAGLSATLKKRKKDVYGILNGVDYSVWSPENDKFIPVPYNIQTIESKYENKKALLKYFGLTYDENIPVVAQISRLAEQKGFDLIAEIIDEMMKLDIQYIVLGTGEPRYEEMLERVKKKYPKKVGVHIGFSEELAHLIEAGADIFLMPSRYEPCGLNQMYSLRYGTVPVVRKTGGLADTVEEFNPKTGRGTGFLFEKYSGTDLLKALKKALSVYKNKKAWIKLMKNGMMKDFSWNASAKKYVELYEKLLTPQKKTRTAKVK